MAVFKMTNIVPQSPASNQHAWERLEAYSRRLAKEGHVLYIVAGPYGSGGTEKLGYKDEIGKNKSRKITVPRSLWKVILVLPSEDAEPRKNTRVIAVLVRPLDRRAQGQVVQAQDRHAEAGSQGPRGGQTGGDPWRCQRRAGS
jgi:DNA/RNA endonuclease G (NUC1)